MGVGNMFINEWFSFQPYKILIRPWGVVTYMFVHGGFWHLFVNMFLLFFLGPPLERKWGSGTFLRYFVRCGLGGAVLSYAFVTNSIIGASAGVYGVMLAFAITWPNVPMYVWGIFPIRVKWLVSFMFAFTFLNAVGQAGDGVAHLAHLGGFLAGFAFLPDNRRFSNRIRDVYVAIRNSSIGVTFRNRNLKFVVERQRRSAKNKERDNPTLDAVDVILDKIAESGMSSLTTEEKRLLDQVAKKHQSH
jgi:membrane associated rhomboid family serine protease